MNTCRTCLNTPAEKDISELEMGLNEDNKNCLSIMLFCLDIKVAEDSKITTNLCIECYGKIISFYKFKTLALKSDAYLNSLYPAPFIIDIEHEREIKQENIFDSDEFGPNSVEDCNAEVKIDESSLVEDNNVEIKYELDFDNEGTLGNIVLTEEPSSEVQQLKYEYIEEELIGNAPVHKKPKRKYSSRKKELEPSIKKEISKKKKHRRKKLRNDKPEHQICEECGKTVINLKEHSVQHLPKYERKTLQCKACPKQFLTVGGRNKHYRVTHLGVKSKCDICNKEVTCLSVHKLSVHNPAAMRFGCVSCERRFVSQAALDYHMSVHTKVTPFECDTCHGKFRCKNRLARHIRVVHEKERRFQCHLCPKAYSQRSKLDAHMRSHTNERPFKCEECGKAFRDKKTLANHVLIHSGVKKYRCSVCNMAFQRSNYLSNHMISHTKEKRHPCQYCGVRFGRSDHRRRHEFTAHQKHLATD